VFKSLPEELELKAIPVLKEKKDAWHQALAKDILC